MLKQTFLIALFILSNIILFAQDQTMGKKERITFEIDKGGSKIKKKVLIIPFDNKMYMSEVDREVSEENQLDFNQIRSKFRKSLNELLFIALNENYKAFSMLNDDKDLQEDLLRIYYSLGFKYDVVEKTPEEKELEKKSSGSQKRVLVNKKKDDTKTTSGIQKGEVISNPNNEIRFMNSVIASPTILEHLSRKYGAELLIFINQMDIKHSPESTAYTLADNTSNREIKIHYTIMDIKGKQQSAGAAFSSFSGNDNNINNIINSSFPNLVKKILSSLPAIPKTNIELLNEKQEIKAGSGQETINKK